MKSLDFKSLFLGIVLLAPFFSGCLQVEEWVEVNAEGLTNMTLKIRIGVGDAKKKGREDKIGDKIGAIGSQLPHVRLVSTNTSHRQGETLLSFDFEADHLNDLKDFHRLMSEEGKKSKKSDRAGFGEGGFFSEKSTFYHVKKQGKVLRVERTLYPLPEKKTKGKRKKEKGFEELEQMMLGGMYIRFALNLPGRVIAHNGDKLDGTTVHWAFPLSHLQSNKVSLWVDVEKTPETLKALLGK